jgi:hypothetical protein
MDIPGTILELQCQKRRLKEIIANLEAIQAENGAPGMEEPEKA